MHNVNFNADSQEEKAEAAIEWAKNLDDTGNNYLHNLKVICSNEWTSVETLGILGFHSCCIQVDILKEEKLKKEKHSYREKEKESSDYIGNIGDKITIS